jgi:hypothetical protein
LDVLDEGSVVGAYSMINESEFQFTGKARSSLSILTLSRADIMDLAHDFDELTSAIEHASRYILENEVPICDYTLSTEVNKSLSISDDDVEDYSDKNLIEMFRNAVRKARVLNRRSELKVFKLYELIHVLKAEKKKHDETKDYAPPSEIMKRLMSRKPTIAVHSHHHQHHDHHESHHDNPLMRIFKAPLSKFSHKKLNEPQSPGIPPSLMHKDSFKMERMHPKDHNMPHRAESNNNLLNGEIGKI